MPRGMSTRTKQCWEQNALAIYEWIQNNKHRFKRGITSSALFSSVVADYAGDGNLFPEGITGQHPRYTQYCQLIMRMKKAGYLRYQQEVPNGPRVWSVNEAMLPAGSITYTGVHTPIPTPEQPPAQQPTQHQAEAFLDSELKAITLDAATITRQGITLTLDHPTLYQLYKLGRTLNEISEPIEDEPISKTFQTEPDPEPELVEPETEVEETDNTIAPF